MSTWNLYQDQFNTFYQDIAPLFTSLTTLESVAAQTDIRYFYHSDAFADHQIILKGEYKKFLSKYERYLQDNDGKSPFEALQALAQASQYDWNPAELHNFQIYADLLRNILQRFPKIFEVDTSANLHDNVRECAYSLKRLVYGTNGFLNPLAKKIVEHAKQTVNG